jgi:uncharacterized protein (TIGR02246 family)
MTITTTESEQAVLAVLDELAAAHAERDPERAFALHTPDAVEYSLAPPLQQGPDTTYGTVEGMRAWFETFDGPVQIAHRDPVATVDGDVAFLHTLTQMTASPAGGSQPFSFWFRSTYGLRRIDGTWRIAHRHDSTPFYMDGSFRSAVDLQP